MEVERRAGGKLFHARGPATANANISIYFVFPPITQWCSISDVLFTDGRGVSDFSVLKYYYLNINYSVTILKKCLRILIDCSQLSKTYYNVLFGSSTRDRHGRRIIISADVQRITLNASCTVVKWGARGLTPPPAPIWAPRNSISPRDWIYKVLFYAQITPN